MNLFSKFELVRHFQRQTEVRRKGFIQLIQTENRDFNIETPFCLEAKVILSVFIYNYKLFESIYTPRVI